MKMSILIYLFIPDTFSARPSLSSLYQYNVTSNITFWAIKKYIYNFLLTSNMSLTVFKNIHSEYSGLYQQNIFLRALQKNMLHDYWMLNDL